MRVLAARIVENDFSLWKVNERIAWYFSSRDELAEELTSRGRLPISFAGSGMRVD